MLLINASTYQLEHFTQRERPRYAILSHTWGDEEVSYHDMHTEHKYQKKGWHKIVMTCKMAIADDCNYAWVDTCCIDKTSSAVLSEAINSMFKWYQDATVCYAYLEDMLNMSEEWLLRSRWWTRGWTLQELLAPADVIFYNSTWLRVGTKLELSASIERATMIPSAALLKVSNLAKYNTATKMSWASQRQTTHVEDKAYCLLGIFDVNMPLIYGEGRNAFYRLQEEILKNPRDLSILLFNSRPVVKGFCANLLADSPRRYQNVVTWPGEDVNASNQVNNISIINKQLILTGSVPLDLNIYPRDGQEEVGYALYYMHVNDGMRNWCHMFIPLKKIGRNLFVRDDEDVGKLVGRRWRPLNEDDGTQPSWRRSTNLIGCMYAETRIVIYPSIAARKTWESNTWGGVKLSWPGECASNLITVQPKGSFDHTNQVFMSTDDTTGSPDSVAAALLMVDLHAADVCSWGFQWVGVVVIFPVAGLTVTGDPSFPERTLIFESGAIPQLQQYVLDPRRDKGGSFSWSKLQRVLGPSLNTLSNELVLEKWSGQKLCITARLQRKSDADIRRSKEPHATLRLNVTQRFGFTKPGISVAIMIICGGSMLVDLTSHYSIWTTGEVWLLARWTPLVHTIAFPLSIWTNFKVFYLSLMTGNRWHAFEWIVFIFMIMNVVSFPQNFKAAFLTVTKGGWLSFW